MFTDSRHSIQFGRRFIHDLIRLINSNLAETQLKAKGNSKPTNAQIIQAMNKMSQATETQAVEDVKPASPAKEKAVITASQKAMIDEFRNMNFNSPELRVRPYINNANTYAEYFASNSQWSVINTIIADDGGKILIYGDETIEINFFTGGCSRRKCREHNLLFYFEVKNL